MTHQIYYGLDEKPCEPEEAYALFSDEGSKRRQIGKTTRGDITVSTVFLVINHSFSGETPVLYETMIFGGEHDQYQRRYCTRAEAMAGHQEAIELAFGSA